MVGEARMAIFSAEEQRAIADAITRAETKTSGEIVVVVARASGRYFGIGLMWAALLALSVPLPLIFFTAWPVEHIYLAQLCVFAACVALIQWEAIRLMVVPVGVKRARAHEKAVEQFLAQNMHMTSGRTGVLIYVSFAERCAEVIADAAIYEKVAPQNWVEIVDRFTAKLGKGERTQGFVAAIESCGALLAKHFPPGSANIDELPNHLIVLDGRF
jgi:putative membrane protein